MLCNIKPIQFTPQRIWIFALEDDKGEGIGNFNEFLDWTMIKVSPAKGDYPHTNMWEKAFKWMNIYFTADVIMQFYYINASAV
jgi:hypothetical protein